MSADIPQIIITVLIASAFILGVTTFTGDLYTSHPTVQNVSYLDQSAETFEKVQDMEATLRSAGDSDSIIDLMLNGVWKMFRVVFQVLDILKTLIQELLRNVGLAAYEGIFIGIITVTIIFGLVFLIMNLPR